MFLVGSQEFNDIELVLLAPGRQFENHQRRQRHVTQPFGGRAHCVRVRNSRGSEVVRPPGTRALGKDVNLDSRVLVHHFGPATRLVRKNLESGDSGHPHEFVDPVGGERHIDIDSHAGGEPVSPHRPSAAEHRFDSGRSQNAVNRLNHTAVTAGQVLRFQHVVALGHEITRYEKELDQFETRELEAMEEVDGFRSAMKAAEVARAQTRKLVEEDLTSIAQRHERMKADQAEILAERDGLVAKVPETLLPLYTRLMKIKDGLAVAPMRDGKCEGCHMKLIASTVMKVQASKEIAQCEDCGRILYLEE